MPEEHSGPSIAPTRAPVPARSPATSAALLALVYLVIAALYVGVSSTIASSFAGSKETLERIELVKGFAFVLVTACGLFAFNYVQLRQLRAHQDDRLRRDRALHNAERAILAGTFARTVAHDINNALQVATSELEDLRDHLAADAEGTALVGEVREALGSIRDWNHRLFELDGARLFGQVRAFDLAQTVRDVATLARRHERVRHATVEVQGPERLPFRGREVLIQRAVLNLVLNAAEAAGPGCRVEIRLDDRMADAPRIDVDDNGPGVPPELRARILEPFFTTKERGAGLGLASVAACAAEHGGTLTVSEAPLGGARFSLYVRWVSDPQPSPS